MSRRKDAGEWLTKKDLPWAEQYLGSRSDSRHLNMVIQSHLNHTRSRVAYEEVVDLIRTLEKDPEGWKLIQGLRNALRQRSYRSPKNGKKARTFSLPNDTAAQLQRLAKHHDLTETSVVISLIEHSGEQETRHRDQLEMMRRQQRRCTLKTNELRAELNEAMKQLEGNLHQIAVWETSSGSKPPTCSDQSAVERMVRQKMNEARRAIRRARDSLQPINERPSALDRDSTPDSNLVKLSGKLIERN